MKYSAESERDQRNEMSEESCKDMKEILKFNL